MFLWDFKMHWMWSSGDDMDSGIKSGDLTHRVILFQEEEKNRYNLALLEERNGDYFINTTSNNQDVVKIITTVIKTVLEFLQEHPKAVIIIRASDEKRLRIYNSIIQRHYKSLSEEIRFFGVENDKGEPYDVRKNYDWFVIARKNK